MKMLQYNTGMKRNCNNFKIKGVDNMRLKRGLLAGIALCCMPLMTACSAKDTIGILVGNNSEDTKKEEVK